MVSCQSSISPSVSAPFMLFHPLVRIFLYSVQAVVYLLPESNGIKLVLYRLVEALTDAVRPW